MAIDRVELLVPDQVYRFFDLKDNNLSPARVIANLLNYTMEGDPVHHGRAFIHFEGDKISASDGWRFIQIKRDKITAQIPDGAYRVVKDGKDYLLIQHTVQLELPVLDKLLYPQEFQAEFEIKTFDPKGRDGVAQLLYRLAKHKVGISHQWAEQIPIGGYMVQVGKPNEAVIFKGDYFVGISPIKLSNP